MNPFYHLVADRAFHRCEYCHAPELVYNFPFEDAITYYRDIIKMESLGNYDKI